MEKKTSRWIKQLFKRPCKKCEKLFEPEGKFCKFCPECRKR